jgi:hypothetical protein
MSQLARHVGLFAAVVAFVIFAGGAGAQTATCASNGQDAEEVLDGVTLTVDGAYRCTDAPASGTYQVPVNVANAAGSTEAVSIQSLGLRGTSPRPGGTGPAATASAQGLPLTVAPGGSATFLVSGDYALVSTDEGDLANLHLRAQGVGATSGEPFELGLNVLLWGPRAAEEEDEEEEEEENGGASGGPPSWAGGSPPSAGDTLQIGGGAPATASDTRPTAGGPPQTAAGAAGTRSTGR